MMGLAYRQNDQPTVDNIEFSFISSKFYEVLMGNKPKIDGT
jgi:hypothetical protein